MKPRSRSLFLIIICVCLLSASVIADETGVQLSQEDKDKLATTAQKLALCAGVYDMANTPALGLSTRETANGAEMAAAFLLAIVGIIPDWQDAVKYAQNARGLEKTRQAALLDTAGNVPEKITDAVGNLTEAVNECNRYSELQADLAQKATLWMYSDHPNN